MHNSRRRVVRVNLLPLDELEARVKEIVEKYEAGYVVDCFTTNEMEAVVDKIIANQIKFDADKIRAGAKDFYDLDKTVHTYSQVYKKILG